MTLTRRALAAPFIARAGAATPLLLRCSLDSPPSHPRNISLCDFLFSANVLEPPARPWSAARGTSTFRRQSQGVA